MTPDERRLTWHLALAITVKLAALALLWWLFFREAPVVGDPIQAASSVEAGASASGEPR
jgi:hypothetical protein